MIVNYQIRVLADVNRADTLVDAKLDGGIQRDQLHCFVMRQPAKLDGFRGFLIEVRSFGGVIGIHGNNHAAAGHQRRIVRNGVVGFHFIGPPIGKDRSTRARGGDFIGDFVAFEDMLQGADLKAKFLGYAQEHEDFVFAIAVGVDIPLSFQHLDERFEPQIAARRNQIFLAGGDTLVVIRPGALVIERFRKGAPDGFFHAHARGGIAFGLPRNAEV